MKSWILIALIAFIPTTLHAQVFEEGNIQCRINFGIPNAEVTSSYGQPSPDTGVAPYLGIRLKGDIYSCQVAGEYLRELTTVDLSSIGNNRALDAEFRSEYVAQFKHCANIAFLALTNPEKYNLFIQYTNSLYGLSPQGQRLTVYPHDDNMSFQCGLQLKLYNN